METIVEATASYEAWLGKQITLSKAGLAIKHMGMRNDVFSFFRGTYYRWAQLLAASDGNAEDLIVLAVGDLHVENFGTWRDSEGRLVWGINDFDEAWRLPFVNDLVRLACSAELACEKGLALGRKKTAAMILRGYSDSLRAGGKPFVLAESDVELRNLAVERLKDPGKFWRRLEAIADYKGTVPKRAGQALGDALPSNGLKYRVIERVAGMGSLGRARFTAIAEWHGAKVAREVKAIAPSASIWAEGLKSARNEMAAIVKGAVRCPDPYTGFVKGWQIRRLAPDCSRIEIADLPREKHEEQLLYAMGWETANVHLGSAKPKQLLAALTRRKDNWLEREAAAMAEQVRADWRVWRKAKS